MSGRTSRDEVGSGKCAASIVVASRGKLPAKHPQ